mmetsp:Transcript_36939/g.73094  ORF Transcript_36939/g.73094 Transcript_36939/m.73094 type:complete len:276 (+) Transcript_36939:81-908(+)
MTQSKPHHLAGLELIILSILIIRAMRAMPPALAALILCVRSTWRLGRRAWRRFARFRDRYWRRPRYTLRCDLEAVEPGTCPVCLAPLAGPAFAHEDEDEVCASVPGLDEAECEDTREASEACEGPLCTVPDGGAGHDDAQKSEKQKASEDGAPALFRLRCGHTYHAECLNGWLDRRGTCPLCRADVGDNREWVELRGLNAEETPTLRAPVSPVMVEAPGDSAAQDNGNIAGALAEPMLQAYAAEQEEYDVEQPEETLADRHVPQLDAHEMPSTEV